MASDTSSPNTAPPKDLILQAVLQDVAFEGWTDVMVQRAAVRAGLPDGAGRLYFPDGPVEIIRYWSEQMDASAREEIEGLDLESLKIRERVTQGVILRLQQIGRHEEAARRAQARLSLPDGLSTGAAVMWSAADMIWRAIGDTSTDGNFYSKRAVLSGVLASTAPVWLNDALPNKPDARAFLDRRIENVMQFEKVKARVRTVTGGLPDPAELLGRLRYGGLREKGVPTRREKRRVRRGR